LDLGTVLGEARVPLHIGARTYMPPVPFGRNTYFAAAESRFVIADNQNFDIAVYESSGRLLYRVRQRGGPTPLTEDDYQRRLAEPGPDFLADALRFMPRYASAPAHGPVRLDEAGHLWVQKYAMPGDTIHSWDRYDLEGRWVGRLEVPADLDIIYLDASQLLALTRTDLGVVVAKLFTIEPE
jgi:hypothetical protein